MILCSSGWFRRFVRQTSTCKTISNKFFLLWRFLLNIVYTTKSISSWAQWDTLYRVPRKFTSQKLILELNKTFLISALLNVEGKLFFSLVSSRLETHLINNIKFISQYKRVVWKRLLHVGNIKETKSKTYL